jgi:Pentapeptide repeats (9 copies)
LATSAACQYKKETYDFTFTCDESTIDTGSKFCIFHDTNYLEYIDYEEHKEEVAKRFEKKLTEYSSDHSPLKFIGYCLPDISFPSKQFTEAVYFNDATFYGEADFSEATFSNGADFCFAKFSNKATFLELNSPRKHTLVELHSP